MNFNSSVKRTANPIWDKIIEEDESSTDETSSTVSMDSTPEEEMPWGFPHPALNRVIPPEEHKLATFHTLYELWCLACKHQLLPYFHPEDFETAAWDYIVRDEKPKEGWISWLNSKPAKNPPTEIALNFSTLNHK